MDVFCSDPARKVAGDDRPNRTEIYDKNLHYILARYFEFITLV